MAHDIGRFRKRFWPLVMVAVTAIAGQIAANPVAAAGPPQHPGLAANDASAAASHWEYRDLMTLTGAPTGYAQLAFGVAGTDSRVYYVGDNDNHLRQLAYYQGGWHHNDITAIAGTRAVHRQTLAGYAKDGTDPRVYWTDIDEHLHELAYTQGTWHDSDITAAAGAPAKSVASMHAWQVGSTDTRLYYMTFDNRHIHELAYYQGTWHYHDITATTGAPAAKTGDFGAYNVTAGDSRIYYRDTAKHIYQLAYYQGGWHKDDLTATTGAALAESDPETAFTVGGADTRLYYEDANDSVKQLSYYQGAWHKDDITSLSGDPTSDSSGLAGFAGSDNNPRVYSSRSYSGHIYEYAYAGGTWNQHDITEASDAPNWGGSGQLQAFGAGGTDARVYYTTNGHIKELAKYPGGSTPPPDPQPGPRTEIVSLFFQGGVPNPAFVGYFPDGSVLLHSGNLLKITNPQFGPSDSTVYLVKRGHSTSECQDNSAVVILNEGQSTTPEQISALFGNTKPHYTLFEPLAFVACVGTTYPLPNTFPIQITVQDD